MRLKVNVPAGHLKRVNQKLFDMDMQHSHQLGENIFGRYIIIRSVDFETVRKVFDKLDLPFATKLLTK
jgi:hypothetical protein